MTLYPLTRYSMYNKATHPIKFTKERRKKMETTSPATKSAAKLSSKEIKALVASHLAEQPANMRTFHRLMNVLESITVGLIILVFIAALVLSFMWKSIPTQAIPTAWFLLPVSGAILLLLICVHAIVLRIFPPSSLYLVLVKGSSIPFSAKTREFRTGKSAVSLAWGLLVLGVVLGGFFATFAWAAWTVNWDFLTPMITVLGTAMGVMIAVGIVGGMIAKIFQQARKPR